jgi:riboflavin kinase/FMN adenylyltransferase
LIRKLISNGKINIVNKYLDRNWSIDGKVSVGRKMGRKIGFPTCNIKLNDYVIAKPGVYAVNILINKNKKLLRGIANLGYRPTFNQKKILLEVNIFNFSGNLYNKKLTVEFIKFIRSEKKFRGIDQLRKQIKSDLRIAKKA